MSCVSGHQVLNDTLDNPHWFLVGPGGIEPKWLRYSYYTAGTGGAGPTILETSLLLAGEEVTVYKDGQAFILPPISNRREVDFGQGGMLTVFEKSQLVEWGASSAYRIIIQSGQNVLSNASAFGSHLFGDSTTTPPIFSGIGNKGLYVYNLPEVASAFKYLQVCEGALSQLVDGSGVCFEPKF